MCGMRGEAPSLYRSGGGTPGQGVMNLDQHLAEPTSINHGTSVGRWTGPVGASPGAGVPPARVRQVWRRSRPAAAHLVRLVLLFHVMMGVGLDFDVDLAHAPIFLSTLCWKAYFLLLSLFIY